MRKVKFGDLTDKQKDLFKITVNKKPEKTYKKGERQIMLDDLDEDSDEELVKSFIKK